MFRELIPVTQEFKDHFAAELVLSYQEMIEIYKIQGDQLGVARMRDELEQFLLSL